MTVTTIKMNTQTRTVIPEETKNKIKTLWSSEFGFSITRIAEIVKVSREEVLKVLNDLD